MCNCISYNLPQSNQTDQEIVVDMSKYFAGAKVDVCLDKCISEDILLLWKSGIPTINSCCGHNLKAPSIVFKSSKDARNALAIIGNKYKCFYWKMVRAKL